MIENLDLVRRSIASLIEAVKQHAKKNRKKLTDKAKLLFDLREIGFKRISPTKWAYDVREFNKSCVSIIVDIKDGYVDIIEDHLIVKDGEEMLMSSVDGQYTIEKVAHKDAIKKIHYRIRELIKDFKEK